MTRQLDAFEKEAQLEKAFREFDSKNPRVFQLMLERACWLVEQQHRKRVGIAELAEFLRYHELLTPTSKGEGFKINNSHRAFYARKLISYRPDLFQGVIITRKQKAV
jgi:hypothetical protein